MLAFYGFGRLTLLRGIVYGRFKGKECHLNCDIITAKCLPVSEVTFETECNPVLETCHNGWSSSRRRLEGERVVGQARAFRVLSIPKFRREWLCASALKAQDDTIMGEVDL